jgi:hypothetical protein
VSSFGVPISFLLFIVQYANVGGQFPTMMWEKLISWCNEYHFWNVFIIFGWANHFCFGDFLKVISNL